MHFRFPSRRSGAVAQARRTRRAAAVAARGSLREHGFAALRRRPRTGAEGGKAVRRRLARQARRDRRDGERRRPARRGGEAYEALQDLIGRVMSYASLLYASDTSDPARAKFYGDTHERVTALSGDLLFFELELNRIDDAEARGGDGRARARPLPALARGHPQGEAAPARRRDRAAVPGEVGLGRGGLEPPVRRDDVGACASTSRARA